MLVLDMGTAVRIDDVARRLLDQASADVDIVYTGLRPGEKLHEDLLEAEERDVRPGHPLASQVPVTSMAPADALALDPWAPPAEVIASQRASSLLGAAGSVRDGEPIRS